MMIGSAPWLAWTVQRAEVLEAAALELESDVPFRSIVRLTPADQPRPSEEEIRATSRAIAARNDPRALAAFQRGFRTLVVSDEQVGAVRVPTLAVIGTDDPNIEGVKELKAAMPNLDLIIVEGATHAGERGILGRREFFDAIRNIISAHRTGA